jgi:hypothetical protein
MIPERVEIVGIECELREKGVEKVQMGNYCIYWAQEKVQVTLGLTGGRCL